MKKSTEKVAELRARRARLGQKRRDMYLTDIEYEAAKSAVIKIRSQGGCNEN